MFGYNKPERQHFNIWDPPRDTFLIYTKSEHIGRTDLTVREIFELVFGDSSVSNIEILEWGEQRGKVLHCLHIDGW